MTAMPITSAVNVIRVSAHPFRGAPLLYSGDGPTSVRIATVTSARPAHPSEPTLGESKAVAVTPIRPRCGVGSITSFPPSECAPTDDGCGPSSARATSRTHRFTRPPETVEDDFGPVATATADLPEASAWAARMAMSLLQVCLAARPAPQVMRYVTAEVYDSLLRRHSRAIRRGNTRRPMRVRRVQVCHPRDGVVEAAVIMEEADRIRPVALRMHGRDGRWIVTALEIG